MLQGYVEELAVCLVAVEKDTEGKSMERLKALTTELVLILSHPPPPPAAGWSHAHPHYTLHTAR